MKNILILGFSVTAETPGFVEKARDTLGADSEYVLTKVGLGGLQPYHLRHMLDEVIRPAAPDLIVAELATPAFRKFPRPPEDHEQTVQALMGYCADNGIELCFLDLPREDVDSATDWAFALHKAACQTHGLAYLRGTEGAGMLRDVVHPTPAGVDAYAQTLLQLISMPQAIPSDVATPQGGGFGSYLIATTAPQDLREFSRGGYRVLAPTLKAGSQITVQFDKPTRINGISYLMGPKSGLVKLTYGSEERTVPCYDQFCYYERFGAMMFDPIVVQTLVIEQLADVPDTPLLKGDPDVSERVGFPVHLFMLEDR